MSRVTMARCDDVSCVSPCQTGPRQKLDAKFKQGSKLNFNKPLTSFHNARPDRRCHLTKCCNLKVFQGYWKCSCLRMISSELYAWPRAIVKLIWLSGVTNNLKSYKSENTGPWARCHEFVMSRLLSEDCHDRHPELRVMMAGLTHKM